MDMILIEELLNKNPQVNKDMLEKSLEAAQEVHATGVKCACISATPPIDPYSINRVIRSSRKTQSRSFTTRCPASVLFQGRKLRRTV
jgi:hypothetical protein